MNRINQLFASGRRDILSIYFCAGYPDPEYTAEVIRRFGLPCEVSEPDIYGTGCADEVLSIKTAYEERFLGMGLPITYTRFSLGDRRDFPWFDLE